MKIVTDDLTGPEIARFLDEHVQEMLSITPPESKHALDLDGLRRPEVTFWSVMDDDALVGCGAIKRLDARDGGCPKPGWATAPSAPWYSTRAGARQLPEDLAEGGLATGRVAIRLGA